MQKLKDIELIYLSNNVLRTLTQNRILTILDFLQEDVTRLSIITKLNLPQVLAVRTEIFEKYAAPIVNGTTLLLSVNKKFLSTGIESLDTILEGGIPIGNITEVSGLADCGKTQLCLKLAINCAKTANNTVLYVDTKGDFSSIRIQKMLDASGISHKEMALIMYRIKVVRVWKMDELIEILQCLKNKSVNIDNLSLIIIDSLPCLMFQFLGDDNKIGLSMLNTVVNYCRYLSKEMGVCIVCVNIQTRWVDQDISDLEDDCESTVSKEAFTEKRNRCLGKYWQHIPALVLLIEKSQTNEIEKTEKIVVSVEKSNNIKIQTRECILNINILGVT